MTHSPNSQAASAAAGRGRAPWWLVALAIALFVFPSSAFAQSVSENFESHPPGAHPSAWTDNALGDTAGEQPNRFRVATDPKDPGNQIYGVRNAPGDPITHSPRSGTMSTLVEPILPSIGRLELRGRMMRTADESRIGIAFSSGYPDTDSYHLLALWSSSPAARPTLRLFSHGGAAAGVTNSGETLETGTWYRFYILVENIQRGTFIRARVWPDGEREPQTFSINAVDSSASRPKGGRIGLWAARVSRTRGVLTTDRPDTMFDDLEVVADPDAVIEEPSDTFSPSITILESGQPLIDGTTFARDVSIEILIEDQSPFTSSALLNGHPYISGTPITADGSYTLRVTASDSAGNESDATVRFTIDRSVPSESAITIESHTEGARLSSRLQTVTGTARNVSQVRVNGVPADISAGTFSAQISLAEGNPAIEVSALTPDGAELTRSIRVLVDSIPPVLTIAAPQAGSCLDVSAVELSGTAGDANLDRVTVTSGGVSVPATITGTAWRASVNTSEGARTFLVEAGDGFGHTSAAALSLTIDRTPPEIMISENGLPFTAALLNRGVSLLVRATDAGLTIQHAATLNGQPFVSGRMIDAEGTWQLHVVATDCASHRAERTIVFEIDRTAPLLRDLVPAPGASVRESPSSISGITDPDVTTVRVVGTASAATPVSGSFALEGLTFREGRNSFVLEALDRAGNITQMEYLFHLNSSAPAVEILDRDAPIPTNAVFNRSVTPVVRSSDPAASTTASVNGATFTSGTTLSADGGYSIEATATDTVGNRGVAEASFEIDRTPPTVSITSPVAGESSSNVVEVRGTAAGAVSLSINGASVPIAGDSTFVLAGFTLEAGDNLIVATARDRAGNIGRDQVIVTRSLDGPGIIITSPPDLFSTNRSSLTVRGHVLSGGAGRPVRVGTADLLTDAAGEFRLDDFALSEGDNTIAATTGTGPNARTASVRVRVDTTPPLLEILESGQPLEEGSRFAERASLGLQTEDGVTSTLSVDGVVVQVLPVEVTSAGGHIAEAFARDAAGNESRAERSFFIGETAVAGPCIISDVDPISGSVIFGNATDVAGRASGAVSVTLNGAPAIVADSSFIARIELPLEGDNLVAIGCTGADGATGEPVTISLRRITGDPSVAIDSPGEASVTAAAEITVTGTVSADVTSILVSGISAVISNGSFTASGVPLSDGLNVIVAEARNAANRIARSSRRIVRLGAEPVITLTSPAGDLVTGASSTDLSGTFDRLDASSITVTNESTNAAGAVEVAMQGSTSGSFRARDVALVEGVQTIRASGVDRLGRSATATIRVTRAAGAPSITIDQPLDNSFVDLNVTHVNVSGTFAGAPGSIVEVNGEQAAVSGDQFTSSVALPSQAGPHPVIARVTQPDGTSTAAIALVTRLRERPRVVDVFPSAGATAVEPGAVVRLVFSSPMKSSPFTSGAFSLTEDSGAVITGTLDVSGAVITFAPSAVLSSGRLYTIRVTTAAQDLGGNPLENEFVSAFSVAATAPIAPPILVPIAGAGCAPLLEVTGTAPPFARVRLSLGTLTLESTAAADGRFSFTVPLPGDPFYRVVRVRIVGADGSLSSAAEARFRADCQGPQVLSAAFDRTTNLLTFTFSEPMDPATVTSEAVIIELTSGAPVAGTIAATGSNTFQFTPATDLTQASFTLRITTSVRDLENNTLAVPFTRFFAFGDAPPPPAGGAGFVSGEVFDATTGRPLAGAEVTIEVPMSALASLHLNYDGVIPSVERGKDGSKNAESIEPVIVSDTGVVSFRASSEGSGRRPPVPQSDGSPRPDSSLDARNDTLSVLARSGAPDDLAEISAVTILTDARGRYTTALPEGAHLIRVSAPGHTSAWRQIVIPAGAGVVPIDIRLTERGAEQPATGDALVLHHGGETAVTKPITLNIPAGTISEGSITLTAIGAQSLPGLLPLGWSPLSTAEVAVIESTTSNAKLSAPLPARLSQNASVSSRASSEGSGRWPHTLESDGRPHPDSSLDARNDTFPGVLRQPRAGEGSGVRALPGTTLTFEVPTEDITTAAQTITAVEYDEHRNEWTVIASVVNISSEDEATINIETTGIYALVYPDKSPNQPPAPLTGSPLESAANPCTATPCEIVSQSFVLDPPLILPTGRTVATLTTSPLAPQSSPLYPSGTAVQAYIDEELHLADGGRLVEAPFSTDLLLYRTLSGETAEARFHLAPSERAAEVVLEVGYEHIRIFPYPNRLDRGTLLGPEGGRVPSDSGVLVEVPTGATDEILRATASSLSAEQLQSIAPIAGFKILAGFDLDLTRATESTQDLDNDGIPDPVTSPVLNKPARATFNIDPTELPSPTAQLILVEILESTSRLAALSSPLPAGAPQENGSGVRDLRVTTNEIDRNEIPLDGIIREGRYLLLAAEVPIAFATGTLRSSPTGPHLRDAHIHTPTLGVADITRGTGIFNIPVPATPAPPFTLIPRLATTGTGTAYTHGVSPAPAEIVNLGDLIHTPQPLLLVSTSPANNATEVSLATPIRATFSSPIDPESIGCTAGANSCSLILTETLTGQRVPGSVSIDSGITLAFTPGERLKPNSRYAITISPSLQGTNGSRLTRTETILFSTVTQLLDPTIDTTKIHITIPDASGRSRIYGDPGALTSGWHAVAIRRGVDFTTRPQATVSANGSFSFFAEGVTFNDFIDLHVINTAGNVAAIVPLTPFASEDRRTFVARAATETKFTSADRITIHVPAGAFDDNAIINVTPASKDPFTSVPNLDEELNFISAVSIDIRCGTPAVPCIPNERLQIELPIPPGLDTTNRNFLLGLLGNSVRGPRIMIVDTLRVEGNQLTTSPLPTGATSAKTSSPLPTEPVSKLGERVIPSVERGIWAGASVRFSGEEAAAQIPRSTLGMTHSGASTGEESGLRPSTATAPDETPNAVLTGAEVKHHLLGLNRSGVYLVTNIIVPVPSGFVAMEAIQAGFDLFWDHFASLYAADFYLTESRGRIVIPVLAGRPLLIEGVHSGNGFRLFEKRYDPIPLGDPGTAVLIESPNPDQHGPYPVFASPSRVDSIVLASGVTMAPNYELSIAGSSVTIRGSDLAEGLKVQALNLRTGSSTFPTSVTAAGTAIMVLPAVTGDRILLLTGVTDVATDAEISVVFNEPIQIPGTTEEEIVAGLRDLIQLHVRTATGSHDVTGQVIYDIDSGQRRIRMALPGGNLVRGAHYEVRLESGIRDLAGNRLGQGVAGGLASGGDADLVLQFSVRAPHGRLGDFELEPSPLHPDAALRDMARYGNILFVSALRGGLLAYDISDPGRLRPDSSGAQPRPFAFVPGNWQDSSGAALVSGLDEHWAVATDRHGRVYSTGFTSIFGVVRSYRVEDFLSAPASATCATSAPLSGGLCTFHGAAIIGWRPGYSSSIPLATATLLSDRPEATPRKLQVLLQDDETEFASREEFKLAVPHTVTASSGGLERIDATFTYEPDTTQSYYLTQRITVENLTLNKRWSADIRAHGAGAVVTGIQAGPRDKLRISRNLRTWGVVSQFGFGISVIDLNAIESNDAPGKPSGYVAPREQVIATRADAESSCISFDPSTRGIRDLAFSPEAAAVPYSDPSRLLAFGPEVRKGVLGVGVPLNATGTPRDCIERQPLGFLLYDKELDYTHPRLEVIEKAHTDAGAFFNPRFGSISNYRGDVLGIPQDYVLLSGGSLGLLAVSVNNPPGSSLVSPFLDETSLAGLVWIPSGVYAVRTIPDTHLASVVDGMGRVLLVDLSRIDERFTETGSAIPGDALFPIPLAALTSASATPGNIGVDDPRVVWASEPGLVTGTLPPILHPGTGMLFTGETLGRTMHVSSAIDVILRILANLGFGPEVVGGIIPLGFEPPDGLLSGTDAEASSAAFRIEVELPAGVAKALEDAGRGFFVSVESERISGVVSPQTAPGDPKAHLRRKDRDGNMEAPNRSTRIELRRASPFETDDWHQEGSNLYRSDWIVAIADERASVHYAWPAGSDKAAAGCNNCERPDHLAGKTETDGVYELWTDGRFITVRPETGIFEGTAYEYLEEAGRLETRVTTFQARKTRDATILVAAQNPPVAEGALQETHYIHSGEIETAAIDMNAGGRAGIDVVLARHYRSGTIGATPLGEGWDSPIFRTLIVHPNGDVEYHDGAGEIWLFRRDQSGLTGYISPRGLFLELIRTESGWTMIDQQWRIASFDDHGRLVSESDEFFDPASPGSGNTISYLYDETGRLARIIDPLGRETTLEYWSPTDAKAPCTLPGPAAGEPCGFGGRLKEVRSAWRNKSVAYQYDRFGHLVAVNLPEVSNSRVPELSHTGDKRPTILYRYLAVPAPSPDEPAASAAYTQFALWAGNITGIKDPEQTALRLAGKERVTFAWEGDRNIAQTWGTGETATFGINENTDVLGQRRTYTLTPDGSFDRRRHFATKQIHDVPVVNLAEAGLPDIIGPSASPALRTLETVYQYNDHGQHLVVTMPSGLVITNTWTIALGGAPGTVLQSILEKAPTGAVIETQHGFDPADNALATVFRTGRRDSLTEPFSFRENQSPSRNRRAIETSDTDVVSTARFDERGQLSGAESGEPGGSTAMKTTIEYYGENASNPIESGRPRRISRGNNDVVFTFSYSLNTSTGEETETTTDVIRGVVTTIRKDTEGRVIARRVAASSSDSSGVEHTDEAFGYDAEGRLALQSRAQAGVGTVSTITEYDVLGRPVTVRSTGSRVLLDTSVAGDGVVDLVTKTNYDLGSKEIVDLDPHRPGEDATAPRTSSRFDGLGRVIETLRTAGTAPVSGMPGGSLSSVSHYDVHGQLAYVSDRKRAAALMQHDHFGRPLGLLLADGVRSQTTYNEWDEVVESHTFARRTSGSPLVAINSSRNIFTPQGRLRLSIEQIDTSGRSRGFGFSWTAGDAVTTHRAGELAFGDSGFADAAKVRVRQSTRDSAGRVLSEIIGESEGPSALVDAANSFSESHVTEYAGGFAKASEMREPRAARRTEARTEYDMLGRPVAVIEGGGAFVTLASYDQSGNVLTVQSPGLDSATMAYDARGLMWREQQPDGSVIRRVYDERGTLRQYIDEEGKVTHYDADVLGRIWRIRYPDATREEARYEEGSGALLASRNRAGEWIWFEYDSGNNGRLSAEHLGGSGVEPDYAERPFTRYQYDDGGRLTRVSNADAAVEYADFDLLGRPGITRQIRFRKTGCIPAAVACGSGLTASPQIAEIYTQGHEWSVFDERSRWRMPVIGSSLPTGEAETFWRNWIVEEYDGGANLERQEAALSRTSLPDVTLSTSTARGIGRLAQRERAVTGPLGALTRFGYADLPGSGDAVVPVTAASPGAPTGALGRSEFLAGGRRIEGSEITLGTERLVGEADALGLSGRESEYAYDERARLETSILLQKEGVLTGQPRIANGLADAGLLDSRSINPPRLGSPALAALGATAQAIVPLSWNITERTDAHQATRREFSGAPDAGVQQFQWRGGRRVSDEGWRATFDVRGRLLAQESPTAGRRIVYDYDPNDRLIGRVAFQLTSAGTWTLETRTNVLARDALPAEASYVWDPIVDRLIAIYDSRVVAASLESSSPVAGAGLVKQIVHGDQRYDDPIEVLVATGTGVIRYLPILDEAGTGSLVAVADDAGRLVERVLYADPYGDAPRYLTGAVVEEISVQKRGETRSIHVEFSEAVDPETLAPGMRLAALSIDGSILRTSSVIPSLTGEKTATWTVPGDVWATFANGAASVQIGLGDSLRFPAWGERPLQTVAEWECALGRACTSAGFPLIKVLSLSDLEGDAVLYDVPDLYLVARPESIVKLHFDFHALPLRDPATQLVYVRARWYDSSTGSFITPDPMGYVDASNLYAYAGNDPVNFTDPTGLLSGKDAWRFGVGVGTGFLSGGRELLEGTADLIGAGVATSYNAVGAGMYELTGSNVYREQSEAFHQAYDSVMRVAKNPDVIVTAVANKLTEMGQTLESGDADQIGNLVGRGLFEVTGTVLGVGATSKVGKLAKLGKVVNGADAAGDTGRTATQANRIGDLAGLSNDGRRASVSYPSTPIRFRNLQLQALLPSSINPGVRRWQNRGVHSLGASRRDFDTSVRPEFVRSYADTKEGIRRFSEGARDRMRRRGQLPEGWIVHHKRPLFRGGDNEFNNFRVMRETLHWRLSRRLHRYPEGENPYGRN